jgi:cobalt-zinc-cadmium efflux system outer membrane protein
MSRAVCGALLVCLAAASSASAQIVLTKEDVIARARNGAAVVVARARVAEAEGARLDLRQFPHNPVIEGSAGPRSGVDGRSADVEIAMSQQLDTTGRQRAALDAADASVDRRRAEASATERAIVAAAVRAFVQALADTERLALAQGRRAIDLELLAAVQRRFELGEVPALDVALVRVEAARSDAAAGAATADLAASVGVLRRMLRIADGDTIRLDGTLDAPSLPGRDALEAGLDERPDLAALDAEAREGEAQVRLGRALAAPELGLRAAYERDDHDTAVIGGMTVTLPFFQRGQGAVASGTARTSRARLERDATRRDATSELRARYEEYGARARVVEGLSGGLEPAILEAERLARASFDAGEMTLAALVATRRVTREAAMDLTARRHEAAVALIEVEIAAGTLR